jgi:RNA polymerase sigma-70 factor (ECF subfamily)
MRVIPVRDSARSEPRKEAIMNVHHAPVADSSSAFVAQIDSHRPYLMRAARMKLRDAGDVEDVVQDTMIAAWNGRAGFRGQSSMRTWLVGILNHKVVDLIRDRQRRPTLSIDALDALETLPGDDDQALPGAPAQSTESAAATYERRAFCEQVLGELEAYSPKAAKIFVMREIEGEETRAICRRLKVSNANCYVLLHRARQFLHQRFATVMLAA